MAHRQQLARDLRPVVGYRPLRHPGRRSGQGEPGPVGLDAPQPPIHRAPEGRWSRHRARRRRHDLGDHHVARRAAVRFPPGRRHRSQRGAGPGRPLRAPDAGGRFGRIRIGALRRTHPGRRIRADRAVRQQSHQLLFVTFSAYRVPASAVVGRMDRRSPADGWRHRLALRRVARDRVRRPSGCRGRGFHPSRLWASRRHSVGCVSRRYRPGSAARSVASSQTGQLSRLVGGWGSGSMPR